MAKDMKQVIYESLLAIYKFSGDCEVHIISSGMTQPSSIVVKASKAEYDHTGEPNKLYVAGYSLREALDKATTEINKLFAADDAATGGT